MINFDTNHPKQSHTFTKNSANSENVEENAKKIISHLYGPTAVVYAHSKFSCIKNKVP